MEHGQGQRFEGVISHRGPRAEGEGKTRGDAHRRVAYRTTMLTGTSMSGVANYPSLSGRVVLITGGGSGIGASFTEHFCRQGCRVAFFDIDDGASNALVARLTQAPGTEMGPPLYLRCDITDIAMVRACAARVEAALGPVQVLINNAALDERKDMFDITPEFWDSTMAVNLRHQFFVTQAVAHGMIAAGGGSVITMGSISWIRGRPGMAGYTTSKAGINGLTRTLARELGDRNIRVNCIVPGAIVTARQRQLWQKPEDDQRFLDLQCLKFRLQPEEVARAALFLASDESRGITGQNIVVDAGIV
jgi:NAD(P)-dependent dehydrogenase (short-subunit alcohol dehydrogenase family)